MALSRAVSAVASLFLVLALFASVCAAQQPASPPPPNTGTPQATAPAATSPGATAPEEGKVKGYTLSPEKYEKAVAFSRAQYLLYFVDFVYGLIVLLLILRWRLAPSFRDWAERASRVRFVQAVIFAPLILLTISVLGLPTTIYGHWLSRHYGISVQGWGSWTWDWTKGQIISIIIGSLLVWGLYAVIRRSARRWWFYFWLAAIPFVILLQFLAPVIIAPLFNKFEPLEKTQPALVAGLESVVHRAGMNIPPERMFLMKASEKTKALNAYVAGFGASKRVVVFDTTIQKMTVPETVFVFGHEMGHYVLGHVWKLILFIAALLFVLLYLGYRTLGGLLARRGSAWGIRGQDDWASLPALLFLLSIFSFLASPATSTFSRHLEHEADIYGLEVTHGLTPDSSEVAAQALQILGEVDLADPDPNPFIKVWLYSHPPLGERVIFARTYDPWEKGKSPQFVK